MELNARQVDWQEEFEDWSLICPVCDGTGRKSWEILTADEKKEVKEECIDANLLDTDLDNEELTEKTKEEIAAYKGIPFVASQYYNDDRERFDFHCEHCQEGTLEMYWNTVWDVGYSTFHEDAISMEKAILVETKTACHIVYNIKEGKWYLTLSGCGMDLTPDLCYAFMLLGFKWLPTDWAHNLSRGYTGCLSKEQHAEIIKFAIDSLKSDADNSKRKIKELEEAK